MTYLLTETPTGVTLKLLCQAKWHAYQIDFDQGPLHYRFSHLQGKNELIAKAVGWKKGSALQIFDTTAGLGREAFLLAALGCQVTLFERHPAIATLLKNGLQRASLHPTIAPIIKRMTLIESCAILYLQNQELPYIPDVIYCDPMFEARTKSAAVKKEMQILQSVVGPDTDAEQLVAISLKLAKKRVVVKRAHAAPALHTKPDLIFKARSHRFDVYLKS